MGRPIRIKMLFLRVVSPQKNSMQFTIPIMTASAEHLFSALKIFAHNNER